MFAVVWQASVLQHEEDEWWLCDSQLIFGSAARCVCEQISAADFTALHATWQWRLKPHRECLLIEHHVCLCRTIHKYAEMSEMAGAHSSGRSSFMITVIWTQWEQRQVWLQDGCFYEITRDVNQHVKEKHHALLRNSHWWWAEGQTGHGQIKLNNEREHILYEYCILFIYSK